MLFLTESLSPTRVQLGARQISLGTGKILEDGLFPTGSGGYNMRFPKQKIAYLYTMGNPRLEQTQAGAATSFIISAVIVQSEQKPALTEAVRAIREVELDGGELQPEAVEHGTRFKILRRLLKEPFEIAYVVLNKNELYLDGHAAGSKALDVVGEMLFGLVTGGSEELEFVYDQALAEYLARFEDYVANKGGLLFSPYQVIQSVTAQCDLLQLAHFIAGMLKLASEQGAPRHHLAYLNFLRDKITARSVFGN